MVRKKGLAGAEDVEVYGDHIPVDDAHPDYDMVDTNAPYTGETQYVHDPVSGIDQPVYVQGTPLPSIQPKPKPDSSDKPDTVAEEVVEDVPVDPWTLPEHEEVPIPDFDSKAAPALEVDPAPAYKKSAAQQAWEDLYGGTIEDILAEGGRGIDEETQTLMRKQIRDVLRSREEENLRTLHNRMEERGITNSGLIFSEEQKIKATTTKALAASMTEIKIKSAFMKMASFENALGQSGQFLGYLAEQSMYAHSVEMTSWQNEQQAKLIRYQANVEIFKIKLQDAYNKQNMYLQQQLQSELNTQMHQYNVEIAEMEIEWAKEQSKMEMQANIFGVIFGGISGLL